MPSLVATPRGDVVVHDVRRLGKRARARIARPRGSLTFSGDVALPAGIRRNGLRRESHPVARDRLELDHLGAEAPMIIGPKTGPEYGRIDQPHAFQRERHAPSSFQDLVVVLARGRLRPCTAVGVPNMCKGVPICVVAPTNRIDHGGQPCRSRSNCGCENCSSAEMIALDRVVVLLERGDDVVALPFLDFLPAASR